MCWQNGKWIDCTGGKQFNNQGQIVEKTITQKISSATAAAAAVITGKAITCPDDIKRQRLKICAECEHIKRLNALPKGAPVAIGDTCSLCGCYLKGNRVTSLLSLDFCKTCYAGTPEFVCPLTDENGKPTPKWGFEFGEFELNRQPETVEELSENLIEEKDL